MPDLNAVPSPCSKPVLAGDSKRRQALLTLLDILGFTTDEIPSGVGAYFQLVYASVLRTSATGGQGHRTGTEDEREIRMYQGRYHGSLMPISSSAASADEHLQRLGAESFGRFQRCGCPKAETVAITCHSLETLQESRQLRQRGTVGNVIRQRMIRLNILASAPQLFQCRPPARQFCGYHVLCFPFTGTRCSNRVAFS